MIPLPQFMHPHRIQTKEQLAQIKKNMMAAKIMAALKSYQPKPKKRKRK